MPQLFANNAATTINGSLSSGATTLVLLATTGAQFPAPSGEDYFLGTIFEKDLNGTDTRVEVVKVTARTADTLTIVRDFENLTGSSGGYAYPSEPGKTVYFDLRWTAHAAGNVVQKAENLADLPDAAAARGNLGLDKVNNTSDQEKPISTAVQDALDGKSNIGHAHAGYEPADATILKEADIGEVVQAYDPSTVKTASAQTLTNKTLGNPVVTDMVETRYHPAAGTAFTVDWANGTVQRFTTSGNITITLPASVSGKSGVIEVAYGGPHTVTFAGGTTIKHPGGTAPTATSVSGKIDRYLIEQDGTISIISDAGRNI